MRVACDLSLDATAQNLLVPDRPEVPDSEFYKHEKPSLDDMRAFLQIEKVNLCMF